MAKRPVFMKKKGFPFYEKKDVEFVYSAGFSIKQKQKSFMNLHKSFLETYPGNKILEISTKSNTDLGVKLSAFIMKIYTSSRDFSVECAFQGSKVFEGGGPYIDLLNKTSIEAKKDVRIRNSGRLEYFEYFNRKFVLEPKDYFYNWLYINALSLNRELAVRILEYNAFTDIEFNPNKSINCQAKAAAIFVGLHESDKLKIALKSEKDFLNVVYEI